MPFGEAGALSLPLDFSDKLCPTPTWSLCSQEEASGLSEASNQCQQGPSFSSGTSLSLQDLVTYHTHFSPIRHTCYLDNFMTALAAW